MYESRCVAGEHPRSGGSGVCDLSPRPLSMNGEGVYGDYYQLFSPLLLSLMYKHMH